MKMNKAKITQLQSKGPVFPEPYKTKGLTLNGEKLPALAEEMLWKAAKFIDSDYEKEAFFSSNKNMWTCLKPELTEKQSKLKFPEDFLPLLRSIKAQIEAEKEAKKKRSKEEKEAEKAAKEKLREEFGYIELNGKTVKLQNFMIEAPDWILTRGKDPRKFNWKYAVKKEDVVLNIVNGEDVPGYTCESNPDVFWIMKYHINCGRPEQSNFQKLNKRIFAGEGADMMYDSIRNKFDKAADILKNWKHIQKTIKEDALAGKDEALITYLIQQTGIRIGNERDAKKQALTYGMSTLEGQHLKFTAPNKVAFNFLGKDSVPENREIEIDKDIWNILNKKELIKNKKFFKDVDVNKYIKSIHPGATAKNLRTVVCNETLINNLKSQNITKDMTEAQKLRAIFLANLEIAKTLNHQKNVGKNQKEQETKMKERVKKNEERIKELKLRHKERLEKLKAQKEKAKLLYKDMPKMKKEKLDKIKEQEMKLLAQMDRALKAAEKSKLNLEKKKMTKDVSLGTSLSSYADLRILKSFCEEIELPLELIFSKGRMHAINEITKNTPKNYWRDYPQ